MDLEFSSVLLVGISDAYDLVSFFLCARGFLFRSKELVDFLCHFLFQVGNLAEFFYGSVLYLVDTAKMP